jgi:hypothetical protein
VTNTLLGQVNGLPPHLEMEVVQWLDDVVKSRSETNLSVKTLVPVAKKSPPWGMSR